MATKNDTPPPAPAADQPPPPKRKLGKIIIIATLVVVVLLGGGVAAFLLLTKHPPAEGSETAAAEDKPKKKKSDADERKPTYALLEPFTVNLMSDAGDQYLQVAMTLDMQDAAVAERLKIFMAKVRNDIMLHLSGKKPADLASKEGKQVLAVELRSIINTILDPDAGPRKGEKSGGPVKEVLFTSFIIQ